MHFTLPLIAALVALSSATVRGPACCSQGLQNCKNQRAWGCVNLAGPNCVEQTSVCDQACGGSGYAYQKHNSADRQCVCSAQDASRIAPNCPAPPPSRPPPSRPPPSRPQIRGGQCCSGLLQQCKNQGAWGCVQVDAAYCVQQTQGCDAACGGSGYAYRKHNSAEQTCVCSSQDASRPGC